MFEQMQEATENKQKIAELTAQLENVDKLLHAEEEGFAVALGLGLQVGVVEARVGVVEGKVTTVEGNVTTVEGNVTAVTDRVIMLEV